MALPADINVVTITGTYTGGDGTAESGSVTFIPSVDTVRDPANDQVVKLAPQYAMLNTLGKFSVTLVASDDPDIVPTGWYYTVVERIHGHDQRSWYITVPYNLTNLDLADIPEVTDPSTPTYPCPTSAVTSVVGHSGDVTGAEILADATIAAALVGKADDADVTALAAVVATKADDADLDALAGVVAGKADTSALTALVPYTGATGDVNLGTNSLRGENINVNEGTLTDPTVTDLGGLQVSVATVDCLIRSDAVYGSDGWLYRATVPAATLPITDDTTNHLYITWNSGSPIYAMTTDRSVLNLSNTIPVARLLVQSGTVYTQMSFGYMGRSAAIRWLLREVRITDPIGGVGESGLTISETATRIVNVAAGTAWFVLNHLILPAIAQGGSGVTSYLLHHTAGVWGKTSISQYNNTQYDDGLNLVTLTNNRYAVNWIYRSLASSEILIVLGEGDYSAPSALQSSVPQVPQYVNEFYYLVGRIIVQKNASSAYSIENRDGKQFETSPIADHNDLTGIQGGTTGEYFHLTAAELALVGSTPSGLVPYTGATGNVDLGSHSLYAGNLPYSEGTITDPTITDGTGASVNVTSVEIMVRSDTLWGGDNKLYRFTVPAATNLAVTDNALNYIYADYNAGSPIYKATTVRDTINFSSTVPVARIYMSGGNIKYQVSYSFLARGHESRNASRIFCIRGVNGMERESGLLVSETATRVVNVGSGYAWIGLSRVSLSAIAQGGSGVDSNLWYHSGGNWTSSTITQYNNSQYDNGVNLASVAVNKYAVNWVYRNISSNVINIVLGAGDYTLAQAEASLQPALPDVISGFYLLVGRIIVKAGATTATLIESVATSVFHQAAVSNHEDLAGLQGGVTNEHYHLTSAQHAALGTATSIAAGTPASSSAPGTAGQILYDTSAIYVCVATNTWKYIPLSSF